MATQQDPSTELTTDNGTSRLGGVLGLVERVGNKLPNPFLLFVGLLVLIAVASTVVAAFGVTVAVPGVKEAMPIRGALTPDGLVALMDGVIDNFVSFPALGPVLVVVLGVGVAQGTGGLEAAVRLVFSRVPRWAVPYVVALVACQGHVMSDASFLVIPPLAALVFLAVGRHPLAGLIGAYACTATGYGGGLLMGTLDASLAGITQKAASLLPLGSEFHGNIAMNYYFGAAAGLILPIVGGFLIDKVLEPKLGPWRGGTEENAKVQVTAAEKRAVLIAAGAVAVFWVVLVTAWLMPGSPLQGEGGTLIPSPLLNNLVIAISLSFLIFGLVYARALPVEKDKREVGSLMEKAIRDMAGFIVLIFIVSQTLAVLAYSNLGVLMAVKLAEGAESIGLQGFGVLVFLVVLSSLLNLVITSGSGLWSLESTVMVPALMLLDISPAMIQAAHRIGDSVTQAVSPMHIFLYLVLTMARKYEPNLKLGTLVARLLPFVPAFALVWVGILALFFFLDLPPGPGQSVFLP
ncbi:MAG TPA: AbgT family transporter [Kribbella sp.]|uniref:AbgT family transporter n=1 Tax=Kribbella sp. TaxID=1871183 RepID=UPI002D78604D|nr:AbgT family transporter [Kribbella sp.]HET6298809.1 AbgT family transporter [Kribbella sp.]